MEKERPTISETELDVLKVLWDQGPGTVRAVNEVLAGQGRRWAYTTVLTLLHRLKAKGYVASDDRDLAHVFRATVNRDQFLRLRLKDLAKQLCAGTTTPLVQALVEGTQFTPQEIRQFRQLLDRLEARKREGNK
jgi:predicted transcriptional regulator